MSRHPARLAAVFLATILGVAACGNEGLSVAKPQEITPSSDFQLSHRPALSGAQVVNALLNNAGLGLQGEQPMYADVAFFPVTRPDAMVFMGGPAALRRRDVEPDFSDIDFDTHVAFLVAHPSSDSYAAITSGQHATFFSNVAVSYDKDRIMVHLDASRFGNLDMLTMATARWEGKIYPVERRGRSVLDVHIDDLVYQYELSGERADSGLTTDGVPADANGIGQSTTGPELPSPSQVP